VRFVCIRAYYSLVLLGKHARNTHDERITDMGSSIAGAAHRIDAHEQLVHGLTHVFTHAQLFSSLFYLPLVHTMKLRAVFWLLVVLATVCVSTANFREFRNNGRFGSPVYGQRRLKGRHVLEHTNSNAVSTLEYDVEHKEDVVHFRQPHFGVTNAKCDARKGTMTFSFDNVNSSEKFLALLRAQDETVLTGGCLDMNTLDVVGVANRFLKLDEAAPPSPAGAVVVSVRPANLEEVFVNAEISAKFQPGFQKENQLHRRQLDVQCIDGEPDCNAQHQKTYHFGGVRKSYTGFLHSFGPVQVDCEECKFSVDPSITFGITIRWLKLKKALVLLEGDAEATIKVKASASYSGRSSNTKEIAKFSAPSLTFFIGSFPFKIDFSGVINAGFDAQYSARGDVRAGISGGIRVQAGVVYENGQFVRKGAVVPRFDAVTPTLDINGNVQLKVSVAPELTVSLNNVIRSTLTPSATLDFSGGASGTGSIRGVSATFNGNIDGNVKVDVSGNLGVIIRNKKIGPQIMLGHLTVVDVTRPLWQGSHTSSNFDLDDEEGLSRDEFFDSDDFEAPVIRFQSGDYVTKYVPEEEREDGEEEDEIQKI